MSEEAKFCKKCSTEKPKTEFYKQSASKDGLCPRCKSCESARAREWRARNPERCTETARKWKASNPERYAANARAWYAMNREKDVASSRAWREANPERYYSVVRAWQKDNPEKVAAISRKRRAKKLNSEGSHTAADVKAIFESQRGLCATCSTKLIKSGKNRYHVDHIQPLAKGGTNDKYNLQCLCPGCNQRKSAKDPFAWAKDNGKLL